MKALVLAAGLGTRLAPLTDDRPKCMVAVNGTPILFQQLNCLLENGVEDITVISGYQAELLEATLAERYPMVHVLRSVDYAATNNMYSAYLGREAMDGEAFLMLNADVFFDSSVLAALLRCPHPNAIVTEVGRWIEESMKVRAQNGRLTDISKTIPPEEAYGTTIDVYKFSPEAGAAFFAVCKQYIEEQGERKLWSEVALNDALKTVEFRACPLEGRWLEIDNHDDLQAAEALFRSGI